MRAKRLSILKRAAHEYKDHVPGQLLFSSANRDWNNLLVSDQAAFRRYPRRFPQNALMLAGNRR